MTTKGPEPKQFKPSTIFTRLLNAPKYAHQTTDGDVVGRYNKSSSQRMIDDLSDFSISMARSSYRLFWFTTFLCIAYALMAPIFIIQMIFCVLGLFSFSGTVWQYFDIGRVERDVEEHRAKMAELGERLK